ncbi:ABC transporter substrate-binding protein [Petrocella sp. FN5]|uniref:ABC transporter substrate-binding protein n=1 Tax=Petrocella sp. FN5 TaxID=3032002 RepID=UPI0023DAC369|nr:extracellular solute-binding protein [Petrocella sp. FN5]MDF1617256.1 extracellular solute-binding protein [Petrocella sp. FN5]
MNSGNEPDIFNIGGPVERDQWIDFLEPLTNQPWVEKSFKGTLDMLTIDGEVYGQPYNIEGYGLIYNVDMFQKAGINPENIKTLSSLEAAFAKLEDMKDTLGIEDVLSFSIVDTAWWTAAIHAINIPFAKQENPLEFIENLNNMTATMSGNDRFMAFTNLMDLYFKYSYSDLMTVSYDDQVGDFALGKTAVLHQGNWTIGMLDEIDPDLKVAFLPHPLNDDSSWTNGSIPIGVPNYWCVNKKASEDKKDAAKLFLDYMASSERGAKFLVEECSFIPAFSNIKLEPSDQLAASILEYSAKGDTVPWVWMYTPSGFCDIVVKEAIQNYYLGNSDKKAFLEALDKGWTELSSK